MEPRGERAQEDQQEYKFLTDEVSVWNFGDPPIRIEVKSRDGTSQRTQNVIPEITEQWKYLYEQRIQGLGLNSFVWENRPVHVLDHLENVISQTFSPILVNHGLQESNTIKEFRKTFSSLNYLPSEVADDMTQKCEDLLEKMKEFKKNCLRKVEEEMDKQIEMYRKNILEKYSRRKYLCDATPDLPKKLDSDEVNIETETDFSRLVMNCEDSFSIIFSFLSLRTLLMQVMPSCAYFSNYILTKVPISVGFSFSMLDNLPLRTTLGKFRIRELLNVDVWGAGVQEVGNENVQNLYSLLDTQKDNIQVLDISRILPVRSTTDERVPKKNEGGPEVIGKGEFYEKVGECKKLEVLSSSTLPRNILKLSKIRSLRFSYCPVELNKISFGGGWEGSAPGWRQEGILRTEMEKKRLEGFKNYFDEISKSGSKILHEVRMLGEGIEGGDEQAFRIIGSLFDSISRLKLNLYQGNLNVGMKGISHEFLEFLARTPKVIMEFKISEGWGDFLPTFWDQTRSERDAEEKRKKKIERRRIAFVNQRLDFFSKVLLRNSKKSQHLSTRFNMLKKPEDQNGVKLMQICLTEMKLRGVQRERDLGFAKVLVQKLHGFIFRIKFHEFSDFMFVNLGGSSTGSNEVPIPEEEAYEKVGTTTEATAPIDSWGGIENSSSNWNQDMDGHDFKTTYPPMMISTGSLNQNRGNADWNEHDEREDVDDDQWGPPVLQYRHREEEEERMETVMEESENIQAKMIVPLLTKEEVEINKEFLGKKLTMFLFLLQKLKLQENKTSKGFIFDVVFALEESSSPYDPKETKNEEFCRSMKENMSKIVSLENIHLLQFNLSHSRRDWSFDFHFVKLLFDQVITQNVPIFVRTLMFSIKLGLDGGSEKIALGLKRLESFCGDFLFPFIDRVGKMNGEGSRCKLDQFSMRIELCSDFLTRLRKKERVLWEKKIGKMMKKLETRFGELKMEEFGWKTIQISVSLKGLRGRFSFENNDLNCYWKK